MPVVLVCGKKTEENEEMYNHHHGPFPSLLWNGPIRTKIVSRAKSNMTFLTMILALLLFPQAFISSAAASSFPAAGRMSSVGTSRNKSYDTPTTTPSASSVGDVTSPTVGTSVSDVPTEGDGIHHASSTHHHVPLDLQPKEL